MAEAIVRGVVRAGVFRPEQILAADVSAQRRALFSSELKVAAVEDNIEVARQARTIVLSVKPQQMGNLLTGIGPSLNPEALIISIAAGVGTRFIETQLGGGRPWRVIRTMPNTPMLVGEGMVALARGKNATEADAVRARQIFAAAADVIDVREDQLDAVTAVSGSGPAYFFFLVEQMIQAGVELGLTVEQARQLSAKTALGAARMLAGSTDTPEELRRKVTSPGGTTAAAIACLEQNGWPEATVHAIEAAARRSKELGMT
jgi:pyrroline-5-carboxylate reductase